MNRSARFPPDGRMSDLPTRQPPHVQGAFRAVRLWPDRLPLRRVAAIIELFLHGSSNRHCRGLRKMRSARVFVASAVALSCAAVELAAFRQAPATFEVASVKANKTGASQVTVSWQG